MTKISIIVAADQNNLIGGNNQLIWHIPEDLKFFKAKTLDKPIIMGRKTYESIGRPLPRRPNIVITRDPSWQAEGVTTAPTLADAINLAKTHNTDEVFIIGGGNVYEQALQFATCVYLTRIHKAYTGDTYFPPLAPSDWQLVSEVQGEGCAELGIAYTFMQYTRL